jgi:hypothetical protein
MRGVGNQELLEVKVRFQIENSANFFLAEPDGKILDGQV